MRNLLPLCCELLKNLCSCSLHNDSAFAVMKTWAVALDADQRNSDDFVVKALENTCPNTWHTIHASSSFPCHLADSAW
jgi:hypothetical protein